jgi:hypothetical protein
MSEDNKTQKDDSKELKPWQAVLIVFCVFVIFGAGAVLYFHFARPTANTSLVPISGGGGGGQVASSSFPRMFY